MCFWREALLLLLLLFVRFGPPGQEVSSWVEDNSEDDADGLREETGSDPGARRLQQPAEVRPFIPF